MKNVPTRRNADLRGRHGLAWITDLKALKANAPDSPPLELQVCQFVIEAKYAHPIWSHYLLSCYALRDHPLLPPANKITPSATHELALFALDPNRQIVLNEMQSYLIPPNFVGQFSADSDRTADLVVLRVVQDIINGVLNPDTDFRQQWRNRFLTGEPL